MRAGSLIASGVLSTALVTGGAGTAMAAGHAPEGGASHAGSPMSAQAVANWVNEGYPQYNNECVDNALAAGAKGRVNITTPVGNPNVLLRLSATNLVPGGTYTVYIDLNGTVTPGPWSAAQGTFVADASGDGDYQQNIPTAKLPPGSLTWGIAVNGPVGCGTVLATENNLTFNVLRS